MARIQVQDWFEKHDSGKTGWVDRALVESLLSILLGADSAGISDYVTSITNESKQTNYNKFLKNVFGEFSEEGFRWEDGAWLGGADTNRFPHWNIPGARKGVGQDQPALGAEADFKALLEKAPGLEPQSVNRIKKCPSCGKPNAYTMERCNGCGSELKDVPETTTANLFVGMLFGVAKAPFPLKISLRTETQSIMVFDDPLAITRAHVLAVPTNVYVGDIRSLFVSPGKGLKLVQRLETAAWEALVAGPLSDAAWRRKAFSKKAAEEDVQALRKHVVKAFNLPPSQYQLHLQYMMPPLLPSHYALWKKGTHYVKMRHFPYAYVVKALETLIANQQAIPDAEQMKAEELVEAVAGYGVDYEAMYKEDQDQLGRSNAYLANWSPEDFEYLVAGDRVTHKTGLSFSEGPDGKTAKEVEAADKMALQGYGRPYGADGKPGGVYYSHTRAPAALPGLS